MVRREKDGRMKKSISIPEWHEMAERGEAPPMRILIRGNSMFPLIRINRDYVTIQPLEERPAVGDIVLFFDPRRQNCFMLHRVWKTEKDRVLTWGDNCDFPDEWLPWEAVWGKATLIERGRRTFCPDPRKGMVQARFWHAAGRCWRLALSIARRIKRGLKKLRK